MECHEVPVACISRQSRVFSEGGLARSDAEGGGGRDRGREEIGERDGTEPKIGSQGEEEEEEVNKRGRGRKGEEGIEGGRERKKRR